MPKDKCFELTAKTMIENMATKNIEGFYAATKEEATRLALSMIEDGQVTSWGGSMTIEKDLGLLDILRNGDYKIVDRTLAKSPEEARELYSKTVLADNYFMSTNAITLDGELVNIDGNGNRVACLIAGPKKVIVIAGMNKVCKDIESAYKRVKVSAAPPNCVRLNRNTPCAKTGVCADCYSPECICSQIVVTRRSSNPDRIKVILVGEELGY